MNDTFFAGNFESTLSHQMENLMTSAGDYGGTHAERMIINDFGHQLGEKEAEHLNAANGWLHMNDSTALEGVGNLLQSHGLDYHRVEHGTVDQLMAELKEGRQAIVGLHDKQLGGSGMLDTFFHDLAGLVGINTEVAKDERQAIAIKGLDESDPAHPKVVLHHPKEAGATISYSLDDFAKAWHGSDFSFVATNASPTEHAQAHPKDEHSLLGDLFSKAVGLGAGAWVSSMGAPPGLAIASGKLAEEGTEALTDWIKSL